MSPRHTSAAVLIIPLILIMLPARRSRPLTSAPEIGYYAIEKAYGGLGSGSAIGYIRSLSAISDSTHHFSIVNTSASSLSQLLPSVSFPSGQPHPMCHRGSYMYANQAMSLPWPLEPGICGAPRAAELVRSHPVASDESRDDIGVYPEVQPRRSHDCPHIVANDELCGEYCLYEHGVFRRRERDHLREHDRYKRRIRDYSEYKYFKELDENPAPPDVATPREMYRRTRRYRKESADVGHGQPFGAPDHDSTTKGNLHARQSILDGKQYVLRIAALATGSAFLVLLCTFAGLLLWCKRKKLEEERPILQTELCPPGPRRYRHHELAIATHGFAEQEKIGRGGFGPVYRGRLNNQDCRYVAIKVLSEGSSAQGRKEFEAEVKVMTRLRHRNIVQLLGWCDGPEGLFLVYELLFNGSLEKHLYDHHKLLIWSDRYKIALGVGSAILYLHSECEKCVIHGDIKPANIMLDFACNAKLGDFGLARLVDHGTDSLTTQVVAGTLGYIDPEFVNSRRPSTESDVYSFGVLLLEIACGRRPTSAQSSGAPALLNWVRDMHSRNSILEAADPSLDGEFDERQMSRVLIAGLWCTQWDPSRRPSITQAMDVLRREDAELPALDPETHGPDHYAVLSLEGRAFGDLSSDDSGYQGSTAETEYHTSKESTHLLAQE
ncbi:hypothetical protein ACP70R_006552 [Stipagrostis hirtigluma subsp. patula]